MNKKELAKEKGVPSAVDFPHCAGSGEELAKEKATTKFSHQLTLA